MEDIAAAKLVISSHRRQPYHQSISVDGGKPRSCLCRVSIGRRQTRPWCETFRIGGRPIDEKGAAALFHKALQLIEIEQKFDNAETSQQGQYHYNDDRRGLPQFRRAG